MKGVRGTDGVLWYWKDKRRVRYISERLPRRQVVSAVAAYDVLVMLCNDRGDKVFTDHVGTICQYTGLSFKTASLAIRNLCDIGLLRMSGIRRKESGAFAPRRFEILKGPLVVSDDELTDGHDGVQKPSRSAAIASESDIEPSVSLQPQSTNRTEEERTRENKNVVVMAKPAATVTTIPPEILERLDATLGSAALNRDILTMTESLLREHGEEHFARALTEAALRMVAPNRMMPFLRSTLDSQAKNRYAWEPKRRPATAERAPDPELTFFQSQPLYRQLSNDLASGPAFAYRRMEQVAEQLHVDLREFVPLTGSPPVAEQESLIRRFVSLSLRSSSPPHTPARAVD